MFTKNSPFALLLILSMTALDLWAQEWPQWRGPDRDGIVRSVAQPENWPASLKIKWRVTVGSGHSSPVLADGKFYQFARQGEREVVTCFDPASGRILWQEGYPAPYRMNPAARSHGKGPKSTPVVWGGRVFTLGISGILSCFDAATGEQHWRKAFADRFKSTSPLYGSAMSPLVADGMLIAHVGGDGQGAFTAFSADTGEARWSWDGDGPGYASPIIVTLGGTRQIVTQTQEHLAGIALATGKLLWKIPFETAYVQNIVTPVLHQGTLIFSGLDKGIFAIRVSNQSGVWTTDKIWENKGLSMYMTSPVLMNDLMFGLSHRRRGQFFCLDAATGKSHWVSEGRQGENAAILGTDKWLFLLTTNAELIITKAGKGGFEVIRKYRVAESPTWAHPVVLEKGILIKDESSLAFWTFE